MGESANLSASRQPSAPSGRARWGRARWSADAQRALLAVNLPLHLDEPDGGVRAGVWMLRGRCLPSTLRSIRTDLSRPFRAGVFAPSRTQGGASAAIAAALCRGLVCGCPCGAKSERERLQPPQNGQPLFSWFPSAKASVCGRFELARLRHPTRRSSPPAASRASGPRRGRLGRSPASRGAPGDRPPPARFPQLPRAEAPARARRSGQGQRRSTR